MKNKNKMNKVAFICIALLTLVSCTEKKSKIPVYAWTGGPGNATDKELYEALDNACALEYINELPLKIDSTVGEKGLGFSEGQIQRICIARALLRQSPILLLDEATSALDVETEEQLIKNLKSYTNKTIVAVTHRPSILSIMDRVVYLNE